MASLTGLNVLRKNEEKKCGRGLPLLRDDHHPADQRYSGGKVTVSRERNPTGGAYSCFACKLIRDRRKMKMGGGFKSEDAP